MEISRLSSKGQVTIPKSIRDFLQVNEGDRIAFIQNESGVLITKASLIALQNIQNVISNEMKEKGITEEDVLIELENVRKEMWDERNR